MTRSPLSGLTRLFSRGWKHLLDQALSSLSNVLATVMVARSLGIEGFGRFAVVFAVLTLVLGGVRGLLGTRISLTPTPADARREGAAVTGLLLTVAPLVVLVVLASAFLLVGRVDTVVLVVALATPIVCTQDVLRHVAIAAGRPGVAVASDGVWCAALLIPLVLGKRPDAGLAMVAWGCAASLALGVAAAGLRIRPAFRGSASVLRRRVPVAESLALSALTGAGAALAVASVAASVIGPAAPGALRGASTLMGPLSALFAWSAIALTPAVVRRPAGERARICATVGAALGGVALAWTVTILLIPDDWGRAILADSWDGARSVLAFTSIEYIALAIGAGATLGLKVGGHARVLMQQKTVYAIGVVALAFGAAHWVGTAVGIAAALGLAAVIATLAAWWRLARAAQGVAP